MLTLMLRRMRPTCSAQNEASSHLQATIGPSLDHRASQLWMVSYCLTDLREAKLIIMITSELSKSPTNFELDPVPFSHELDSKVPNGHERPRSGSPHYSNAKSTFRAALWDRVLALDWMKIWRFELLASTLVKLTLGFGTHHLWASQWTERKEREEWSLRINPAQPEIEIWPQATTY